MSAIILPRKHYTQPQGRVTVDWSNPHTRALHWAISPASGIYNAADPATVVLRGVGTAGYAARTYGLSFENLSNISGERLITIPDLDGDARSSIMPTGDTQTFLYVGSTYPRAEGGFGAFLRARVSIGSASSFLTFADFSQSNSADWRFSVTSTSSGYSNKAEPVAVSLKAVFTEQLLVSAHFVTGEVWSGVQSTGFSQNGFSNMVVGHTQGAAQKVKGLFGWARDVPEDEVWEITRNPWQIFRADPVRIYSLPPVISIPTLSAASFAGRVPSVSVSY